MVQIFSEVLFLVSIVAVVGQFLELLPIWQQALPPVEPNIMLRKMFHDFQHLVKLPEIHKKAAFGVDVVDLDACWDLAQGVS